LAHYQAAVEILQEQLKSTCKSQSLLNEDEAEIRASIVRALIGMVEIWMDPSYDLWYDSSYPTVFFSLTFGPHSALIQLQRSTARIS
jgi:hypothetical protein